MGSWNLGDQVVLLLGREWVSGCAGVADDGEGGPSFLVVLMDTGGRGSFLSFSSRG